MKLVVLAMCASCGGSYAWASGADPVAAGIPDIRCSTTPTPPHARHGLRHWTSHLVTAFDAHHRGHDLVTTARAETQTIDGWITYGPTSKSLEDEDVDVLACTGEAWQLAGTARTDHEGHFALVLAGTARLPLGMRDLYVAAPDGTGARFLALVAADDAQLVVSDVDGTLTSSENAFVKTVVLDRASGVQDGAAAAYRAAAAKGFQFVYLTARGNQFTDATRAWLAERGFPRGPLRLAPEPITLPGKRTTAFKTEVLAALPLPVAAAIGNRASDIAAYTAAGVAPDRIFIKLPEYAGEVRGKLDAGAAVGFVRYDDLRTRYIATW